MSTANPVPETWELTGTTVMGQIERAVNRIYGMESDRPAAFALVTLALGGSPARAASSDATRDEER